MRKYIYIIILGLLCLTGFILRFYLIPSHLFFGPEQGRDLLVVRDIIVHHKLTLIGAKTDIAGIFHGPLFYYLAAIPFALSGGNPVIIFLFFVLFHVLSIPLLYYLVLDMTGKKRPAFLAAGFFAVSYQAIVYARWLSNPPLSIPFVIFLFYSIIRYLKGNRSWIFGIAIAYGLLGQVEFINYILFGPVLLFLAIKNISALCTTKKTYLLLSLVVLAALSFGTYAVFDVRHDFLITKSVFGELTKTTGRRPFMLILNDIVTVFFREGGTVFGFTRGYWGFILFCSMLGLWVVKKQKNISILMVWLTIPFLMLIILRFGIFTHLIAGLLPAWIIGTSFMADYILSKSRFAGFGIITAIITISIMTYAQNIPANSRMFFHNSQHMDQFAQQVSVVHEIFRHANGKPFYFQAFTIPFFWQDAWKYLFWHIGSHTYHYVPQEENKSDIYVIIPKIIADPFSELFQQNWYRETVSGWGKITFEKKLGVYTIEKREK